MPKLGIDWNQHIQLLGIIADKEIAKQLGCSEANVKFQRRKRGIKPALRKLWDAEDEQLFIEGKQRCRQCDQIKPLAEFTRDYRTKNEKRRLCKTCGCQIGSAARRKQEWVELLGGECQRCGYKECISALQFHHVAGEDKKFELSRLFRGATRNNDLIRAELDKCCLLCSNCHDGFHANQLQIDFIRQEFGYTVASN